LVKYVFDHLTFNEKCILSLLKTLIQFSPNFRNVWI